MLYWTQQDALILADAQSHTSNALSPSPANMPSGMHAPPICTRLSNLCRTGGVLLGLLWPVGMLRPALSGPATLFLSRAAPTEKAPAVKAGAICCSEPIPAYALTPPPQNCYPPAAQLQAADAALQPAQLFVASAVLLPTCCSPAQRGQHSYKQHSYCCCWPAGCPCCAASASRRSSVRHWYMNAYCSNVCTLYMRC